MIRSKFSLIVVYGLGLVLVAVFLLGLWGLFGWFAPGRAAAVDNKSVFPGILLMALAVWQFYALFKRVFFIKVDADEIRVSGLFSRQCIARKEIRLIDLLARKSPYGEAISIKLTDGQEIHLFDIIYRNMPGIKRMIRDQYGPLVSPVPAREKPDPTPKGTDGFYGKYYRNFPVLLFFVFASPFMFNLFKAPPRPGHLLPLADLIFFLVFYIFFGYQSFFFILSGESLEVRNYLFFWYRRRYPVEKIIGVVMTYPPKMANSLRIRTEDFASANFGAGSLRPSDWKTLLKKIQRLGIPIVNPPFQVRKSRPKKTP